MVISLFPDFLISGGVTKSIRRPKCYVADQAFVDIESRRATAPITRVGSIAPFPVTPIIPITITLD